MQQHPPPQALSHDDLESKASTLLGKMIFAFSRMDVNLALYLRDHGGPTRADKVLRALENTSFKVKLDLLLGAVRENYAGTELCVQEFTDWHKSADSVRQLRNDLIHGRWGVNVGSQQVVNVIGLPGLDSQTEVRYYIEELEREVDRVQQLALQFWKLREKWPF